MGLTISVGAGTSKSVAKIASDMEKPDGLTVVAPGEERSFLAPLPARDLWGVGPKTAERLKAEGVETIGDIAGLSEEWVVGRFGKHGRDMRRRALGEDDGEVRVRRETKSVSAETTFERDSGDAEMLAEIVNRLSQRVAGQLSRKGAKWADGEGEVAVVGFYHFYAAADVGWAGGGRGGFGGGGE